MHDPYLSALPSCPNSSSFLQVLGSDPALLFLHALSMLRYFKQVPAKGITEKRQPPHAFSESSHTHFD